MKRVRRNAGLVIAISSMLRVSCEAQADFQVFQSGTAEASAQRNPGDLLTLDIVATSIASNLDSFTYRIIFPNQLFTLLANTFSAPFDNTLAPSGFNGSVPWSPLPIAVADNADAGSPAASPFVPDLYRTTATTTGIGVTGQDVVLETLTLRIPSPSPERLPATYPVSLNILEAADSIGLLVSTTSGTNFILTVTRPVLEVVGFSLNKFTLKLVAAPGNYVVEVSTDLVHWSQAGSVTVTLTPASFTDVNSGLVGSRFYRARTP
jgi:hypothetical protein